MPLTPEGFWVPEMFPKQLDVYNCTKRLLLVCGPKFCGKTIACAHRIIRHAWETRGAVVAVFSKTIGNAKSGVWDDISKFAMDQWVVSDMESPHAKFEWIETPKRDSQQRHYFKIRNYWGGESVIKLYSLDFDGDAEKVLFSARFSMIYFSEFHLFKDRNVFDAATMSLRIIGLPDDKHQLLLDTNPAEEGTDHFAYKIFYEDRLAEDYPDKEFQADLGLIEFEIDDNTFLTDKKRREIKNRYAHSPSKTARYVHGKWEASSEDAIFSDVFDKDIHLLGDISPKDKADWSIIVPSKNCHELISGWDIGDRFSYAGIVEKQRQGQSAVYSVIDELFQANQKTEGAEEENISLPEFVEIFMVKKKKLEEFIKDAYGHIVKWRHWSDNSAFNSKSILNAHEARVVELASAGEIRLIPVTKGKGSVVDRVDITRLLLHENRLFVSANCRHFASSLISLRWSKSEASPVIRDKHKHPFDGISYILGSEEPKEVLRALAPKIGKIQAGLISMPL